MPSTSEVKGKLCLNPAYLSYYSGPASGLLLRAKTGERGHGGTVK
jgi:hypothetical protein